MAEDIFIKVLKFGQEKKGEPVTQEDVFNLFVSEGFFSEKEQDLLYPIVRHETSFTQEQTVTLLFAKFRFFERVLLDNFYPVPNVNVFVFRTESYFKLLEFEELKLARENSKTAKTQSTIAIAIAIFSVIVSAFLGFWQIEKSTNIDEKQFNALIQSIKNADTVTQIEAK